MTPPRPQAAACGRVVLIVDDHRSVRTGLRQLLLAAGLPVSEIRLAANLGQAGHALAAGPVDLVVLDLDLAGEDGLDLLPQLPPATRVLVHSAKGNADSLCRAQAKALHGFVPKGVPTARLLEALRGALQGAPLH